MPDESIKEHSVKSTNADTWSVEASLEYLRGLSRSTTEVNFIPRLEDYPGQIVLPKHWHDLLNPWRDQLVQDLMPRLSLIGVDVDSDVTLVPETLQAGDWQGEVQYNKWAELAAKTAYQYKWQGIAGLVIIQKLQGWRGEGDLFTPKATYQLLSKDFSPNLLLWVTPNDNCLLARSQDTRFENRPERAFEIEREQRRENRDSALRSHSTMPSDYKLALYQGLPSENLKRIYPPSQPISTIP